MLVPDNDGRAQEEQLADMFLLASLITCNSWRFNYARDCTPARIAAWPFAPALLITTEQRAELVADIKVQDAYKRYQADFGDAS